ncbi:hypothetical protein DIS24_g5195 [Lasiodiplodia hormozganensis]|uniref:Uncharacterized protein n=1 Tax=Lasiodiplodia hormozganensis TaxID=869390 RepID=A0AA39YLV1_9PEZI|nr:hypothetical protein DIS24_g5195 [Lasiodiplodia hormozganensis]
MGFFTSLSAAASKATKSIAKAVNTAMETITNTAKKVKNQLENTTTKVQNNFKVFCAKAPRILKKTFLDLRCALRIKVRRIIEWVKAHPYMTAAIVVAVILAIVLPPVFLHCLGFTAAGVAAGSVAAAIQASIGSVAAGSTFAILTSAMMGGYGVAIVVGWIISSYLAIGLGILIWKWFSGSRED